MAAQQQQRLHQEIVHTLNTDCVEWCPGDPDLLALGCYELNEKTGDRKGGIDLYRLKWAAAALAEEGEADQAKDGGEGDDGAAAAASRPRLELAAASRGLPGVFDARWVSIGGAWALSAALADGTLRLLRAPAAAAASDAGAAAASGSGDNGDGSAAAAQPPALEEFDSIRAASDMALCVDWAWFGGSDGSGTGDDGGNSSSVSAAPRVAAVSGSSGTVTLLQVAEAGLRRLSEWHAHELEVWAVALDRHRPHVIYTGADDCAFKGWDARAAAPAVLWPRPARAGGGGGSGSDDDGAGDGDDDGFGGAGDGSAHIFSKPRTHTAGVCCVASHPTKEHLLATGSYDERIRVWDTRNVSKPLLAAQAATGGGVWRLKWHPSDPELLLAACMHDGFAVARVSSGGGGGDGSSSSGAVAVSVVEEYRGHGSLAYGGDWRPRSSGGGSGGGDLVATCSFYDRKLHLWRPGTLAAGP